jgi:hypothetical protein
MEVNSVIQIINNSKPNFQPQFLDYKMEMKLMKMLK